jgi:hypothetical protein
MKRIYITFGGASYDATTERIVKDAPQFGADEVWVYDDRWLTETEFYRVNQWLWDHHGDQNNQKRGFGWFAWKPFILLDALSRLQDGDVVLYTDADTYPIADFSMLHEECSRLGGVMLFEAMGCPTNQWTKRDCFAVMGQDQPEYWNRRAGVARFMLFERGPWKAYQFLVEWQAYCLNPLTQTFDPSVLGPELDGFREHRAEQAIMTLLGLKYGFKFYREACQFGDAFTEDRELYPTLFHQVYSTITKTLEGSRFRNMDHAGIGR